MLKFTKMQGLGNDYVYMDVINQKIENEKELAIKVSDRHFGIGSDGLILICKSEIADFKMRILNSDGSEAEMCGNGIRCVGKFVYDNGLTTKTDLKIETLAGIKELVLNVVDGKVDTVRVNMGNPILEPELIPVKSINNKVELNVLDRKFDFTCVSMGNPHAITIVDDTKNFDVEKYGKIVEVDNHFPNRTNVEFINVIDKNNINMRVWERGAGETLACGTGSCASTVACVLNGLIDRKVNVHLLGGDLLVEWNEEDNNVYMTGEAKTVFEGIWLY